MHKILYLVNAETLRHSYAYELYHCLLIKYNPDVQIQAWLEPKSPYSF